VVKATLLVSVAGVGMLTAAWLRVTTLNFMIGLMSEAVTAYAGLAPVHEESGTSVRRRGTSVCRRGTSGYGGNKRLRIAL
jgi:transposase